MVKNLIGGFLKGKASGSKQIGMDKIIKSLDKVPLHVAEGVTSVISDVTDYLRLVETESTKRVGIIAKRDVALTELKNKRDLFEQLMRHTFEERAAVLSKQFQVLDRAMESGDTVIVKNALDSMVNVIQSSPFKSIQEMQVALSNKEHTIKLE